MSEQAPAVDLNQLRVAAQAMIAELRAGGAAPGIEVGETAPDFVLPDANGNDVALADRRAHGPVVVSFYRGAWCPYGSRELQAQQAALDDIRALGVSPRRASQSARCTPSCYSAPTSSDLRRPPFSNYFSRRGCSARPSTSSPGDVLYIHLAFTEVIDRALLEL